jgi:ubiquinone/menaquinone biosynthesis C-methylase UbiE
MKYLKAVCGALNPCVPETVAGLIPVGARIIDIGCGEGRLLQYLEENGWLPVGTEPDAGRALKARQNCPRTEIVNARAEALPCPASSFDTVVMECAFSLCDPEKAVSELNRVLAPGGTAIITDLYAHVGQAALEKSAMVRNIYPKDMLEAFFHGEFILTGFEDHTHELTEMFAQMIMDGTVCACVAPEELAALRSARPGYGIWLWTKR